MNQTVNYRTPFASSEAQSAKEEAALCAICVLCQLTNHPARTVNGCGNFGFSFLSFHANKAGTGDNFHAAFFQFIQK